MIKTIDSDIYTVYDEEVWNIDQIKEFYKDHDTNTIIEFINNGIYKHVTYDALSKDNPSFSDIRIPLSIDMFYQCSCKTPDQSTWIVCDENGQYLTVLHDFFSYYTHRYDCNGDLDLTLINRYDTIILYGLNEYSVELYMKILPHWSGSRIILCGEWILMGSILPSINGKDIMIQKYYIPGTQLDLYGDDILHVMDQLPKNEDSDRYFKKHIIMYDELMIYTFCFAHKEHFGDQYPDKKFFIIDGSFRIEGIFGIQDKIFTMVRYAVSKGYIPVVIILSSDKNMYADGLNDDIWSKFMNQPCGYSRKDISNAQNVYLSPNANCLTVMRHILKADTRNDIELVTDKKLFNNAVESYISAHLNILPEPDKTLGVLIRGTDYTKTKLPGHSIHADVPEIIDKIREIESEHPYKWIYLATEDADILADMKKQYGERLLYTDQERFSIESGELLIDHHEKEGKEKGKGFRLGVEYLLTLRLLSMCESLIASGNCGGSYEAIKENAGKYRFTYIFEKGTNPRP